jgi:hypothetical protein
VLAVVGTGLGALPAAAEDAPNSDTGYPVFTGDAHPVPDTGVEYTPRSQLGAIFDADLADGAGTDPSSDFWIDTMLARTGTAGSHGDSNQWLFTRGRAVFMKEHSPATLGFGGQVAYWESIDNRGAYTITASVGGAEVALSEATAERKQTPSYWRSVHESTAQGLRVVQTKFITDANVAVTTLEVQSTGAAKTVTLRATSPYAQTVDGAELTGAVSAFNELTTIFPRLSGDGFAPDGGSIQATLEVPAGGSATTKVQLGFVTDEIAESRTEYDTIAAATPQAAYTAHVTAYNRWWAENVPYLDTPEDNIDKTLFYRWWLMRFNFLDADIPGNDYQFPTSMEGVLGYNNAIVLTTGMFIDDLKYFRDPIYSYGPWVSAGETSKSAKYVDNPGDPANWSNSYTQYISEAAWRAYQLHGGPTQIAGKLAQYAEDDVEGLLEAYDTDDSGLIDYNWGAMTGNDADAVSFHERPGASMDRTENAYLFSNATAAAHAYRLAGDTAKADEMDAFAAGVRSKVLDLLWDPSDKLLKHRFTSDGTLARWKETNNYYPFTVGLVPKPGDADYDDDYVEALRLFADGGEYPIFPFFTANQADKAEAAAGGEEGSNNFSVINSTVTFRMLSSVLRDYDTEGRYVDAEWYKKLLYWNAWAHYQNGGDNRLPDQNEFWSDGSADPQRIGYRSWIHHTILGATNFTVIEDAMGLRPREDAKIELDPIDVEWDHFTANNVRYRDKDLTVTWDAPGGERHYGDAVPEGYSVFLDGELAFTVDQLAHVVYDPSTGAVEAPAGVTVTSAAAAQLQAPSEVAFTSDHRVVDLFAKAGTDIDPASVGTANLAERAPVTASFSATGRPAAGAVDGTTVNEPFWGTAGSPDARDSIEVDLGSPQPVDDVRVYFYSSSSTATVPGYAEPSLYTVEYLDGAQWKPVPSQARTPAYPRANLNRSQFPEVTASKIRVTATHASGAKTGIKEVQVFGTGIEAPPSTNLAPHVDAWRDAGFVAPGQARLVGTVKDDGLPGDALSSTWSVVSAPEGGTAVFDDATQATTVARFTTEGEYTLRLTASDGELETVKDLVVTGDVATGGTNVALSATPTAEFTAGWNDVNAVNNGTVLHSGGAQTEVWATWSGNRPATRWLEYAWTNPVRVASTEVSFWGDQGANAASGSGVNIPKGWTAQTWDGSAWVDVTATSDYTVARSEPNTLTFAPVTTTRLRLVLEAAGPGTGAEAYAAVGVSEWKVFAVSPDSVEAVDVRTGVGVLPTLPTEVTGVFSDGSRAPMAVAWAPVTADQVAAEGSFAVVGVVDGSPLPAQATVWVRATPPGQINTVDPVAATTAAGTPPQLPPTVTVQFNDGSRTSGVQVTWDEIDPSAYAAAGTFTVDGAVADSPVGAVATVTVREVGSGEDTTKPVVTLSTDPVAPDHGWSTQDVTVRATATDDQDPAPSVELSLDGSTWSPATEPLVLTAEGQHVVRARATDVAGNVSAAAQVVVSIDRTAPSVTPVPDPVGRTVKAACTDAGSGLASIEYRVGEDTAWTAYTRSVLVGLDETTVTLRATDTAGNVSADVPVTVPASDGSHRRNVGLLATPTASVTAGWNTVAGLNDDVAPTSSGNVDPDDNAHVWGAWPEIGTQWVQYDWDEPVTVDQVQAYFVSNLDDAGIGISVPRAWTAQHWDEETQAWVDVDSTSGYPTEVDAFNEVTFSEVTTTRLRLVLEAQGTVPGEGSLGIKEWQVFEASDVEVPDTQAPVLTVEVPSAPASGWYTTDVTVTAAAVDDRDGSPAVEVSVGDKPWTAWTGSLVLDTDALHTLSFRATDTAGNVSAVQAVEVGRDTTAPEPAATFDAGARTVTVTASDALSGVALVEHSLGEGPWVPTTEPVTVGDTAVTVRYRATDVAGNVSGASSLEVPATQTEPTPGPTDPTPGPTDPGPVDPTDPSGQLTGAEVVTLGVTRVAPGGQVPVTVTGAEPGAVFRVELHSEPVVLGTLTVGADGTGAAVFTVPASTSSGDHKIVLVLPGGSVEAALTVVAVDAAGPVTPGRTPTASGSGAPGGSMASTGADGTVAGALLAGLLLVGGCALTLTVRRRRLSADD